MVVLRRSDDGIILAMGKNQRSPIDGVVIRRQAGQSASAKAEALVENMVATVVFPFAVVAFTLIAEFMRRADGHLGVKGFVFLFVLAAVFSAWQYFKRRDAIRHWLMGANGERYVGQVLDREMTSRGYRVYHDIQIRKGRRQMNIDHLLVGPNGVFLIEDKTWSKPCPTNRTHNEMEVRYEQEVRVQDLRLDL